MITAKVPPLPPVLPLHLSSRSNGRGRGGINPANASFASKTSIIYGASIQQSASVSQFVPWTFVEGLQQAKNARSARCVEGPSASFYEFSSPAVKSDHGFLFSSLTLEFVYLVGGCPQNGSSVWGLVLAASWYTAEF